MNSGWWRKVGDLLHQRRFIAVVVVTLLTLGLVGVVVAATTSVGCSLTKSLAVKSTRCEQALVAGVGGPTPTPRQSPFQSNPSPNPPNNPGSSSNPPYDPGASSSYPPYNPGASAGEPINGPASGYPPLAGPASGPGGPGLVFSCRLPIYAGGPGSGGFIAFPGATFVADPRSAVTAPSPSPGTATPPPPGYGQGYPGWYGTTFDVKYAKWLPVPYAWVSPDGAHYAYPLNGEIYVQSVAGGAELELAEGQRLTPIDVENDGVYAIATPNAGLWFLPFSGAARQITGAGFWQGVSHGAAYGTATSAVPQGAVNTILKLDLASGASTEFFSERGGQSNLVGFDLQGHPVIQVNYQGGVGLFIATGPNTSKAIAGIVYQSYYQPPPFPQGAPIADNHGLWFSVGSGIVLFANGQWYSMSGIGGQLAGQCA